MLQVIQNLSSGVTSVAESPAPAAGEGHVLIRTRASLISSGTERMLIDFGRANLLRKARSKPDQVRQVLEKVRTDGIAATVESVRAKLDEPLPLGYCNAGVVLEAGGGVRGLRAGDRVVSNGPHAEVVRVPRNLCAAIPAGVSDEEAAFTVLGAIALQSVRLLQPTLGESFAVTGLGLVGLLAAQLLRAHGCRVMGIDFDARKLELAASLGVEALAGLDGDPLAAAERFTLGRGLDGVLIAAATPSHEPPHQAAQMCRKRGRVVLAGVTGLHLARDDFYKKELTFQVSCSYGPGRYDPAYEGGGIDYPLPFVRWTAQRNFEAVLEMMAAGRLQVAPLISHRYAFEHAEEAYELLSSGKPSLGVVLAYAPEDVKSDAALRVRSVPMAPAAEGRRNAAQQPSAEPRPAPSVVFIGAGAYATRALMPAFRAAGATLAAVVSNGGLSAAHAARKFGFARASTDADGCLGDPGVGAVVVATRHDTHARFVMAALRAGKHVFVEKPLAIGDGELAEIESLYRSLTKPPLLMVGFNRRFAPHVVRIRKLLATVPGPKSFVYTVNAGALPADHWTQDRGTGGGRLIGEACHFIDLLRHLANSPIGEARLLRLARAADTATISLGFEDGSLGAVHYFANGHKSFPKERLEIFCAGRVLQLDNFRRLTGYGWGRFRKSTLWSQNKGNADAVSAFVEAVREGTPSPIPFEELLEVSRVAIRMASQ